MNKETIVKQLVILTKSCKRARSPHLSFLEITKTLKTGVTPCGDGVPCGGLGCDSCFLNERHFNDGGAHAAKVVKYIEDDEVIFSQLLE